MASCTRKLFTALASEYANLRPASDHPGYPMWEQMVARTMSALKQENANFNVQKFVEACSK